MANKKKPKKKGERAKGSRAKVIYSAGGRVDMHRKPDRPSIGVVFVRKANQWLAYKRFNNGDTDFEEWFNTEKEAKLASFLTE